MNRTTALLAAIAFCAVCSAVYADYSANDKGMWPESWPKELEPLRKQSRTLEGPLVPQRHYEIPFTQREEFESAWPHILKVKSKGAPVILVRSPDTWLGATIKAGVRIHTPPAQTDNRANPEEPLPGPGWEDPTKVRGRWMWTTFIELVVDGNTVDLNRIPLPADTPIIDERFKDGQNKSLNRSEGQPTFLPLFGPAIVSPDGKIVRLVCDSVDTRRQFWPLLGPQPSSAEGQRRFMPLLGPAIVLPDGKIVLVD